MLRVGMRKIFLQQYLPSANFSLRRSTTQAIGANFVGKRDHSYIVMNTGQQSFGPPTQWYSPLGKMRQSRTRSVDQQFANIFGSSLSDTEQPRLSTDCRLFRREPEPCREIPSFPKRLRLAERRPLQSSLQ
jgi:hypothetical protein